MFSLLKLWDNHLRYKDIDYYSYGMDSENGHWYWYLQTASSGYEDYEIVCSKYKLIPLIVGKILSVITGKRLVKW